MLLGDFNAHSPSWGNCDLDSKGREIENFLMMSNYCLLNTGSPTYCHPAHGTHTAIDLSITSPSIFQDFQWKPMDEPFGSDHIPILIQSNQSYQNTKPVSHWNFKRADWKNYQQLCGKMITADLISRSDDTICELTKIIIDAAAQAIPEKISRPNKKNKPWFNETCQSQIKLRKKAYKELKKNTTPSTLEKYRIEKAKTRKVIKENKRTSWKHYVSKLNPRTSSKKVWNMIRKISGKTIRTPLSHLAKGNQLITDPQEIANTLAETFAHNSSSEHYSPSFQAFKQQEEKLLPDFSSSNQENYNLPFSIDELSNALDQSKDTASGPDNIHYQLIKNLPLLSKQILLQSFNNMWDSDNFPSTWRQATILPIPKPGKTHTDPSNYRPISLTSCLCKTFERMINNRLIWILESKNILNNVQCGFRKNRSTTDHLIRLESYIRKEMLKNHHVVAVFFDLEKAYDTVWKHGILTDLYRMGLRGHLPHFIKNFLHDRSFNVKTYNALSDTYQQETGVPQGSILSVTLFALRINEITQILSGDTEASLFVDDLAIYYSGRQLDLVTRHLQKDINQLVSWCNRNGFKFSSTKTTCVHFTTKRLTSKPLLFINNSAIQVSSEAKFLGIIFDSKLTFRQHINQLKAKCIKASNIIKVISHYDWGADPDTLLNIYRTLIRSRIDYGCIIYGSARPSYTKQLDTVANQALRLCLGAFRTSPATSLQVEAHEPPLKLRREKLALQYAIKLSANPKNPAFHETFPTSNNTIISRKKKAILTFNRRISTDLSTLLTPNTTIMENIISPIPPWLQLRPKIILELQSIGPKETVSNHILKAKYQEIRHAYPHHEAVYTDGSKINNNTASAAVIQKHTLMKRIPNKSSIFSAELHAIQIALSHIQQYPNEKYIIFSDSLSSLQAIRSNNPKNPLVINIQTQLHQLLSSTDILFCWIPSHIGIAGNELADKAAKIAITTPVADIPIPSSDMYQHISSLMNNKWQKLWDQETDNKLHNIQPIITYRLPNIHHLTRRERSVITRLRIGHACITHSYLLRKEDKPQCTPCNEPITVEHILLHCIDFTNIRDKYFNCSNINDLFNTVNPINIIKFLKEIHLYTKI